MPSKRAWLGEINKGLKGSQARESKAVQIRVKNLRAQAENERKRNAAYEKSKAQIDAAYHSLRAGKFGDAYELLKEAQQTQVDAGNPEAAGRIVGVVHSAGQVAHAMGAIEEIRSKYPAGQLTRLSVQVPDEQDAKELYDSHMRVVKHFPVLFCESKEENTFAQAHKKEADLLANNHRAAVDAKRKSEIETTLRDWPSHKDARWHLLNGEHAMLSGAPSDAATHYSHALNMCPPERDTRSLRYIMKHGGEDVALAALEKAASKRSVPKEYARIILDAYKSMAFAEVMRQVGGLMAPNSGAPITSLLPFIKRKKR